MAFDIAGGSRVDAKVRVLDVSENGLSVEIRDPLAIGSTVDVDGEISHSAGRTSIRKQCRVAWCSAAIGGAYWAGLWFDDSGRGTAANAFGAVTSSGESDYYELLQLSPNADLDTIHRIFRLMAQRYHPDNRETGNGQLFREMVEAHATLADPVRRAAYDAQRENNRQTRIKIFQTWQNSRGMEAERRKRHGILSLLYGKRLADQTQPAMSIRDLEEMLGCPREHLEFSLWFLREKKHIRDRITTALPSPSRELRWPNLKSPKTYLLRARR